MSEFSPVIWPEDAVPPDAAGCEKCELCAQRSRMIWGEGSPGAPIFVVLDNPGSREDENGSAWVCGTRQTLQKAAFDAGLKPSDLYVTYLLKCRPIRKYQKDAARNACLPYLLRQIEEHRPRIAFCLGNTAVQWFFSDPAAEVKNLRGVWHSARGLPTAVSYHPLAVRRRPNLTRVFLQDWNLVADRYFNRQSAKQADAKQP